MTRLGWRQSAPRRAQRRDVLTRVAQGMSALVLLLAVMGPILPTDGASTLSNAPLKGPSMAHLFGTDESGRDVLSAIIVGARVSVTIGILSAALAVVLGSLIGGIAGFFGGIWDSVCMRMTEIFQIMPTLIVAIVVAGLYGGSFTTIVLVIALLSWAQVARVVRGDVRRLRKTEFVESCLCLGQSRLQVLMREILPNVSGPIVALATLTFSLGVIIAASLNFLGLGLVDQITWGGMLKSASQYMQDAWWLMLFPGLALGVTVASFAVTGDRLADAMDPRERSARSEDAWFGELPK